MRLSLRNLTVEFHPGVDVWEVGKQMQDKSLIGSFLEPQQRKNTINRYQQEISDDRMFRRGPRQAVLPLETKASTTCCAVQ